MAEYFKIFSRTESRQPHLDILLMGITGQGKSATGNSIIGRKQFESKGGFNSVTKDFHVGHTDRWGYNIKIVDIPGFGDTDEGSDEQKRNLVVKALTTALCKFPNGFHVVLLVISYTHRWTKEIKKSVCDMFKTFDEEAFRTHGILVVTSGDAFKRDYEHDDVTLESWLKLNFPEILKICGGRCVLFDNVTKDAAKEEYQNMQLLDKIESFYSTNPYVPSICRYKGQDKKSFEEDKSKTLKREEISTLLGLMRDNLESNEGPDKGTITRNMDDIKRRVESLESIESKHLRDTIAKLEDSVKRNQETLDKKVETIIRAQKELDKKNSDGDWWKTVWDNVSSTGSYLWNWWNGS